DSDLSGACGAVRELPRSVYYFGRVGTAGDLGRPPVLVPRIYDPQHLQPGGSDHSRRPGVQERNPHCAVRQSPSGNREGQAGSRYRGGRYTSASHPHDNRGDGRRSFSTGARDRPRSGCAQQYRHHAGERHDGGHGVHTVSGAVNLHAGRAEAGGCGPGSDERGQGPHLRDIKRMKMNMSGANASPKGRSHQEMTGANASPKGRSHQEMTGANASPTRSASAIARSPRKARSHKRWITIALTVSLLMGCRTVGPEYKRPLVKTPDTFRGSANAAPAPDTSSLADLKWFEVFKDERLQQLTREALESNYDLRDAIARVDAARATVGVTRADQYPNIGVSSNITTSRTSAGGAFVLPQAFEQQRTFGSLALNLLSFEADIWGRLRIATQATRADLLATDENRKTVVMTVVGDVSSAYFNLLELDMELGIAERTLTTRQESLNLIRNRERSGLATLLEVRQGEQLVHTAEQVIPNVEQHIEQTENQISLLLGRNPGRITRGRSLTEQEQPPAVPSGLPSALLERRPDIRAAEQKLIAANALIGVAKTAYYPRISLTGFLGSQSS